MVPVIISNHPCAWIEWCACPTHPCAPRHPTPTTPPTDPPTHPPWLPAALEGVARRFGVPFRHLPIDTRAAGGAGKAAQEAELEALLEAEGIDVIVLARYMQASCLAGLGGPLGVARVGWRGGGGAQLIARADLHP